MNVTEVHIKLADHRDSHRGVRAYCEVVLDESFIVRDIKIVEGVRGLIVSMPSRKTTDHCGHCQTKNPVTSRYCGYCGRLLPSDRVKLDSSGRPISHADACHPITSEARRRLNSAILTAYCDAVDRKSAVA